MTEYSSNPFGAKLDWEFSDGTPSEVQDRSAETPKSAIASWDSSGVPKALTGTQGDLLYYGANGVVSKLGAGTDGQFLKTQGAGANPVWAGGGTYVLLGSATLSSANATLSLNISSSAYKFLKIICLATGSSTTNLNPGLRFNSDNGTNYNRIFSQDSGAAVKTAGGTTLTEHSIDNTIESMMVFDVHNEATRIKHVIGKVYWGVDGGVNMGDYHSIWNNTSDNITNVSLNATASTFAAGTTIYVWGLADI